MFSHFTRPGQCFILAIFLSFLAGRNSGAAEKSSGEKHCLWRVTDAKAPFYLLGSMHRRASTDYALPGVTENAIKQSEQFYFETDPKQNAEFSRKMIATVQYPKGIQIKDKIRPETYKYLLKITRNNPSGWQHMRPWAIAMFKLQHPASPDVSSAWGVERHVLQKKGKGYPSYGLESVDEHIAVFSGMNDAESEVYLLESLVFGNAQIKHFSAMHRAWKSGDTAQLYALYREVSPDIVEAPRIRARLLTDRNSRWIPKIENAIKSGKPTMVVAGALHFSGPGSVIELLRARGYKIEQL